MDRLSNWESALGDHIAAASRARLDYGDGPDALTCAFFAADAVLAMTGVDPVTEFRGKFTTPTGAARALKRYGAGTLEATIDAKFEERPIAFARRGDLIWNGESVGVCVGADALFMPLEGTGLVRVPRAVWRKAWEV